MDMRKVPPQEAATWCVPAKHAHRRRTHAPNPAEIARLLATLDDPSGLTRLDRPGRAGGEHAWRGRIYTRGIELHKQFSDAHYGGCAPALLAAVAWRDCGRRLVGDRPPRPARQPRISRAEYKRMCGWIAYSARSKRYFADGAWGGREAAEAAARAWLQQEEACAK